MKSYQENQMTAKWRARALSLVMTLGACASALAQNAIQSVNSSQQAGVDMVRIELAQPLAAVPAGFAIQTPPRIAIDLPGVTNGLGKSSVEVNQGNVRSVSVAEAGERTRLVLNLKRPGNYRAELQGKVLVLVLDPSGPPDAPLAAAAPAATAAGTTAAAAAPAPQANFAPSLNRNPLAIRDIDFRRGTDGAGRVVVELPNNQVGVDIRQQGQTLVVDFLRSTLPENLRRRLDVTDFGTPVQSVTTTQNGDRVRMLVEPRGNWEHSAYQSDNQFVLEVRPQKVDPNKLVQGPGYSGEKLSLNFQNIEVRALLQVIADFTNFNVVTSDTVTGNVTLRLKDVPWDQALDIILQAKGLGLRKSGNVILIAPKDELNAKEKVELEAKAQIASLEPLRTQAFQLNYAKAADVAAGLTGQQQVSGGASTGSGAGATTSRILSARGSVIYEQRTNQLFVNDVPSKLQEVQDMIAKIDIAIRQVLIESRIVIADAEFGRSLGVKLGASDLRGVQGGLPGYGIGGNNRVTIGGNLNAVGAQTLQTSGGVNYSDTNFVNLPATSQGGLQPGLFRALAVQRRCQPLPEPGVVRARSRRQGQGRVQPAHHHLGPDQGDDQAGHAHPVPAGDQQRRDLGVVRRRDPDAGSDAADHAGRQRHHGRDGQQGQRRHGVPGRPVDRHQVGQDPGAGRERRHGRDRRHLRADRPRRRLQGAIPGRRALPGQPVQDPHHLEQQDRDVDLPDAQGRDRPDGGQVIAVTAIFPAR